ncbi:origin recognition complex subunit 1 [Eurytemora carolleeae]|uniref:origin recognition complex subunit 1 n=1 Tax=Eurytemora carolleeae TaxID=1294199 RepID=UPI000C7669FE|nr:origin recognition complex subunit 1 [Eurytemora carolleeae]|eukprot:XP_023339635.1 origin recognition complex subunit 1-like [Eurytemora affinis]
MWRLSHFYCLVSIRRYFMRFQKCFINLLCIWKTKLFQIIMAPKRRYFTATTKPKFSWIGEEIQPPPHMRKAAVGLKHYKGFSFGDLTAEIGDFVIVKSEDSSEDILSCDVARIERLYEDCYLSGDPYRVHVTWLCRPKDLPKQLSKHDFKEQGAPALDHRLDLILEARNFDTNISAESVYFKCNVFPEQITVHPESFIKRCPESKHPNYILRFKLTSNSKGKTKRNFNLEPYKDGGLSPLKLTALKSPLKEQKLDNRSTFSRDASPEVGKIDKVLIPANFGFLLAQENIKIDKKRRRLSSRESSR